MYYPQRTALDAQIVQNNRVRNMLPLTILFLFLLFVLFFVRLFDLMIISGTRFRKIADDNRIYQRVILPNRGVVFDRDGKRLIENSAVLLRTVVTEQQKRSTQTLSVQDALHVAVADPQSFYIESKRTYPVGEAVAHITGFVGFIKPSTYERVASLDIRVGKAGVERSYEMHLQGVAGKQLYETDATGKTTRLINEIPSIPGANLTLTIDSQLSQFAYEQLNDRAGAVIVSSVPTGEILTLVSSPSFSVASYSAALTDMKKPLINRALSGYPPGSVFKMVTALAALEKNIISSTTTILDEGQIQAGSTVFRNWYFRSFGKTEGEITVVKALARSNDVFFYKLADKVGVEAITATAYTLGFGKKTGIKLHEDTNGVVPTPAWKEKTIGSKWYLGDTYNYGIGQGYLLTTPLQINTMTATLARRGIACTPRLTLLEKRDCHDTGIKVENIEIVLDGMTDACSTGGTAFPFFSFNTLAQKDKKVACKTGTAEFGGVDTQGRKRTHGWLTLLYPRTDPKVAITVLLESSDESSYVEGSSDAAPVAKAVWEEWRKKYEIEQ